MKTRKENSGLHYFDRENGLHVLLDEIKVDKNEISKSPRTISIALTNKCNLNCKYCYAEKNNHEIPNQFLKDLLFELDKLGTLEVNFGGGEPLLYPNLTETLEWIWNNTSLGVNITSNGQLFTKEVSEKIIGKISSIRFSIDGADAKYSEAKRKELNLLLQNIELIRGKIPFGINAIVNPNCSDDLRDVIDLAIKLKAEDVLIIPEHYQGEFILSENDWNKIKLIIESYQRKIQLNLTYNAAKFLSIDYLNTETEKEFLFAHVSADMKLKAHSYEKDGILIENIYEMTDYLSRVNI